MDRACHRRRVGFGLRWSIDVRWVFRGRYMMAFGTSSCQKGENARSRSTEMKDLKTYVREKAM